jgi:hypothetical protein
VFVLLVLLLQASVLFSIYCCQLKQKGGERRAMGMSGEGRVVVSAESNYCTHHRQSYDYDFLVMPPCPSEDGQ